MGPDPFNMPAFGSSPNATGRLQNDVAMLAPLAGQYHGAQTGVDIAQYTQPAPKPVSPSGLSTLGHFLGGVGKEIGHIAGGVTSWLSHQVVSAVEAPVKYGSAIAHGWLDRTDLSQINAQSTQLSAQEDTLHGQFKSGMITAKQYELGLKELGQDFQNLSQRSTALQKRAQADQNQAVSAGIQTAADLVTILTAGFGPTTGLATGGDISASGIASYAPVELKGAADYLASANANALLSSVETGLNKLATDPQAFAALSQPAQKVVQTGVAEVVTQSANMTATQIARASAVNIALKYPIYYQALSSTGAQIYDELDNKKYGAAVRTMAFNAALLLSGGPIGKAMEGLGAGASAAKGALFGESSFIDELSKGIGNGTESGLFDAVMKLPEADRADVIKQLSAVEATNMAATGHDAVAAAWRVLDGMQAYEGASMSTFSHEEALNNMVNFAKAQRLADETAHSLGLGSVTVGRVDARALNDISAQLSPLASGENKDMIHNAWDALKAGNQTQAWANNENLDRQIKHLIDVSHDATSLDSAIRNIKASFNIKGFPKGISDQLAKMGYIPIKPVNLEAPFTEGSGKLVTKFGESDFFKRAVQPLPVLSAVGGELTKAGLSPEASTARVYEVFTKNIAENFSNVGIIKQMKLVGEESAQTSDRVVKQLSDYARNLSGKRPPVTDLRLLTTNDVATALDISKSDARLVQHSIMDSMLKVPLEIRGLGDKVQDLNLRLNPLSRAYARIQGAFRFAWNPFFQAKLATKTEFLSTMEGGGYVSSVFAGEYSKLDGVRTVLRDAGVFEKKSVNYGALGGSEVAAEGSAVGANLTHKLLDVQEKSIAGLVITQADKVGMDVETFVKAYPNQVRDTVQTIVGYDRNAQFLNSPLLRTLNLAFFPARFETKVATIVAKSLADKSAMTQVAVIKGLFNGGNFLKSPEGQAWYSQNAEVIGLFKYFSPLATLSTISNVLGTHGTSIGAYGELGGLPFGWIPMLLDSEGLTHFGQSYVGPKTGAIALDYVPVSSRGQLQTAISDLLGSLYTYPGATVGLPSKGTVDRWAASAITGGKSKSDFTTTTPGLSPEQQGFQNVVQTLAGTKPGGAPASPQLPGQTPGIKVPPEPSPILTPLTKPGGGGRRKKRSEYTPALLPGQSALGQL